MILSVLSEQFYLFGREVFFRVNVEEPAERYAERAHDKDYVVNPIYIAEMQRFCKGKAEKSDNSPDKSDNVREPLFRHGKTKNRRHKAYKEQRERNEELVVYRVAGNDGTPIIFHFIEVEPYITGDGGSLTVAVRIVRQEHQKPLNEYQTACSVGEKLSFSCEFFQHNAAPYQAILTILYNIARQKSSFVIKKSV